MIVYADELLVLNGLVNLLLLLACGRLTGSPVRLGRLLAGAGLGAVYALGALLPSLGFLALWGTKGAVLVGMVLVAYGHLPGLWRYVLLLAGLSAAYGGAVFLAGTLLGAQVCIRNGTLCYPVSWRAMVLTLGLTYAGVSLLLKNRLGPVPRQIVPLELWLGGRRVCTTALMDTGNELRDPLTGQGVVVAELGALEGLLDPAALKLLDRTGLADPAEAFAGLRQTAPGLRVRLFSFRGLGSSGLLLAVGCDRIILGGEVSPCRWAAVTTARLSAKGEYHALAPEQERGRLT